MPSKHQWKQGDLIVFAYYTHNIKLRTASSSPSTHYPWLHLSLRLTFILFTHLSSCHRRWRWLVIQHAIALNKALSPGAVCASSSIRHVFSVCGVQRTLTTERGRHFLRAICDVDIADRTVEECQCSLSYMHSKSVRHHASKALSIGLTLIIRHFVARFVDPRK